MDARYSNIARRTGRRLQRSGNKSSVVGTIRLLVCLGIVLLTFLIKLIFPSASLKMKNELLPVLENSVDYKAAFSSMGKFFSGDAKFTESVNSMFAFLIMGQDAVEADSSVDENTLVKPQEPVLGKSDVGFDSLNGLPLELNTEPEDTLAADMEVDTDEEGSPAAAIVQPQEKDVVELFLQSQKEFSGFDIPMDVNTDRVELPFEFIKPVEGTVSSGFGYRMHPVDNETKFHYGLDYAAPEGSDILSFSDGTVLVSGESENLGYYLIISHSDVFITQYFHCKELHVHGGESVIKGQKIAEVGQTGNATAPCLHFEILYNGLYLNPEYYLTNGE